LYISTDVPISGFPLPPRPSGEGRGKGGGRSGGILRRADVEISMSRAAVP